MRGAFNLDAELIRRNSTTGRRGDKESVESTNRNARWRRKMPEDMREEIQAVVRNFAMEHRHDP